MHDEIWCCCAEIMPISNLKEKKKERKKEGKRLLKSCLRRKLPHVCYVYMYESNRYLNVIGCYSYVLICYPWKPCGILITIQLIYGYLTSNFQAEVS